jgi:hypothetical protein
MKSLTIALALAGTLVIGLAASDVAVAGGGVYYGGHYGGPRVGVGVYVGPGWYGPRYWGPGPYYYPYAAPYYYPPAPYYYPPAVVVPSQPPVYVERQDQPAPAAPSTQPQQSSQWWYYCPSAKAYYPYVKECQEPWQRVSPQPPS